MFLKAGCSCALLKRKNKPSTFPCFLCRRSEPCRSELSFLVCFSRVQIMGCRFRSSDLPVFSKTVPTVPSLNFIWTVSNSPRWPPHFLLLLLTCFSPHIQQDDIFQRKRQKDSRGFFPSRCRHFVTRMAMRGYRKWTWARKRQNMGRHRGACKDKPVKLSKQDLATELSHWAKKPARARRLVIMACSASKTRREGVKAA